MDKELIKILATKYDLKNTTLKDKDLLLSIVEAADYDLKLAFPEKKPTRFFLEEEPEHKCFKIKYD